MHSWAAHPCVLGIRRGSRTQADRHPWKVNLLFDNNLSRRLVSMLATEFQSVEHVANPALDRANERVQHVQPDD